MPKIAGIPMQSPFEFQFLQNPYLLFFATALFWIVAAVLTYLLSYRIAKRLAQNIPGDVDDAIVDSIQLPLLLIVVALGISSTLLVVTLPPALEVTILRLRNAFVALMVVIAIWHLFREILIYYSTLFAERSETSLDDVLIPVIRQIGRIVIVGLGAFFVLQYLGVDLTAAWIAVGGTAFILAFALQDILSNVFSGLSLVVDTPFKYGDLIEMEDGRICRVERIGIRITELYNIADHSVTFMPNSALANEKLLNITKPNTDLRITIDLALDKHADPTEVMRELRLIAQAHPNVLSPIPETLLLMRSKLERGGISDAQCRAYLQEMACLEEEDRLNLAINRFETHLEQLAGYIDEAEERGLTDTEKAAVSAELDRALELTDEIAQQATMWLMNIRHRIALPPGGAEDGEGEANLPENESQLAAYRGLVRDELEAGTLPVLGRLPEGRKNDFEVKRAVRKFVKRRGFRVAAAEQGLPDIYYDRGFVDIDVRQEFEELIMLWNRRLVILRHKVTLLYKELRLGNQQRIDDEVRKLEEWLHTDFKETTPEWKYPDVNFVDLNGSAAIYQLEIQVDDISREHFGRRYRVETELREEIWKQFRDRLPVDTS